MHDDFAATPSHESPLTHVHGHACSYPCDFVVVATERHVEENATMRDHDDRTPGSLLGRLHVGQLPLRVLGNHALLGDYDTLGEEFRTLGRRRRRRAQGLSHERAWRCRGRPGAIGSQRDARPGRPTWPRRGAWRRDALRRRRRPWPWPR